MRPSGSNAPDFPTEGSHMNSIIFTHFVSPPAENASTLELALDRLGAWLDDERNTLGRLLAQSGKRQGATALEALEQLHLDSDSTEADLRDLLESAEVGLDVLLETLRAMPHHCRLQTAWGLPGKDALEAHVRWSGARVEDMLSTLRRALTA
jgi:hypothetical protein